MRSLRYGNIAVLRELQRGRMSWTLCIIIIIVAWTDCCSCLETGGNKDPVMPLKGPGSTGGSGSRRHEGMASGLNGLNPVQIASKIAGFGIMSGSLFLKVPQIVKILSSQSVEGLSPMAIYHEMPLYSSGVIYHWLQRFPLSTYGESLVVLVQNVVIVLLMWLYRKPPTPRQEMFSQIAQFLVLSIIQVNLPKSMQPILVYINIPLLLTSCVPQVNYPQLPC
jgi:hypothetical protein